MHYSLIWISDARQIEHRVAQTPAAVLKIIRKEHLAKRKGVRIITPNAKLTDPPTFRKEQKHVQKND